jgi:hypothetical protein
MGSPDLPTERIVRPPTHPPMPGPMNLTGEADTSILPIDELLGEPEEPAPPPRPQRPQRSARRTRPRPLVNRCRTWWRGASRSASLRVERTARRLRRWLARDDNGLMVITAAVACVFIVVIGAVG